MEYLLSLPRGFYSLRSLGVVMATLVSERGESELADATLEIAV